jgi:hypothetical protein
MMLKDEAKRVAVNQERSNYRSNAWRKNKGMNTQEPKKKQGWIPLWYNGRIISGLNNWKNI